MIHDKNFNNWPLEDIPKRLTYEKCNFSRSLPVDIGGGVMRGTRLFPGDDTPRTFINCNLTNCEPPPGSVLTGCNTHVVNAHIITNVNRVRIDGVEVGRQTSYDHYHYGRFNPDTFEYDDFPSPIVIQGTQR